MLKSKNRSFMDLTTSKRKDLYIQLKNQIRQEQKAKGANFLSHTVFTGNNQWLDIYFLGAKKDIFYNVTIETVKANWHEYVDNIVLDRMLEVSSRYNKKIYDEKLKEFLNEKEKFTVCESVTKDFKYCYGIGLYVVLNVDALTVENINQFIEDFIKNGEKEYQGTEKFHFDYAQDKSYFINEVAF